MTTLEECKQYFTNKACFKEGNPLKENSSYGDVIDFLLDFPVPEGETQNKMKTQDCEISGVLSGTASNRCFEPCDFISEFKTPDKKNLLRELCKFRLDINSYMESLKNPKPNASLIIPNKDGSPQILHIMIEDIITYQPSLDSSTEKVRSGSHPLEKKSTIPSNDKTMAQQISKFFLTLKASGTPLNEEFHEFYNYPDTAPNIYVFFIDIFLNKGRKDQFQRLLQEQINSEKGLKIHINAFGLLSSLGLINIDENIHFESVEGINLYVVKNLDTQRNKIGGTVKYLKRLTRGNRAKYKKPRRTKMIRKSKKMRKSKKYRRSYRRKSK